MARQVRFDQFLDVARRLARPFWTRLLLLAVVVLVPRALCISLTTSPSRDATRYWAGANAFASLPPTAAIRAIDGQPLYPASLAVVRSAGVRLVGRDGPDVQLLASQWWSVLCYLAFILAAWRVGASIVGEGTSWLGCALVSIFPRQVYYSSDVLSDSLHAALWTAAIFGLVQAATRCSWRWAASGGVVAGLASWTRTEAVVLPLTALAGSIVLAAHPARKGSRSRFFVATGVVFTAAWLAMAGAYVAARGELAPKNTARAILGSQTKAERHGLWGPLAEPEPVSPIAWLAPNTPLGAVARLGYEVVQETRGLVAALAIVGVVSWLRRPRWSDTGALAAIATVAVFAMLVVLQLRAGFMASRYLTPVLPFLGMAAIEGARQLMIWAAAASVASNDLAFSTALTTRRAAALATGLVALTLVLCVPGWFRPLHRHRHGQMAAARWIAENTSEDETVLDSTGLVSIFAGRRAWSPGDSNGPGRFAVVELTSFDRLDAARQLAIYRVVQAGRLRAAFPKTPGGSDVGAQVFEIPVELADAIGKEQRR